MCDFLKKEQKKGKTLAKTWQKCTKFKNILKKEDSDVRLSHAWKTPWYIYGVHTHTHTHTHIYIYISVRSEHGSVCRGTWYTFEYQVYHLTRQHLLTS